MLSRYVGFTDGDSMLPLYPKGTLLFMKPDKIESLKIGDVVTVDLNNLWVFHRVYKIKRINGETRILTKGDNNPYHDYRVYKRHDINTKYLRQNHLRTKVLFHVPHVGLLLLWYSKIPVVYIIVLQIILICRIFYQFYSAMT